MPGVKDGEVRASLGAGRLARLKALAEELEITEQELLRRAVDLIAPPDRPGIAVNPPPDRRQIAAEAPAVSAVSPQTPLSVSILSSSLSSSVLPEPGFLPEPSPPIVPRSLFPVGAPASTRDESGETTEAAGRRRRKPAGMLPPDFAEFWAEYPRKVDRGHALKAWQRAARGGVLPPLAEILAALRRQTLSTGWQDEVYIPHPATWINGERWADMPAAPARASPPPPDPNKIGPHTPGALCTGRKGWHMPQYDEKGNYIDD